ncbi:MAG: cytochrome c [Hyphomicrobiales bacterium]|nr:cytochrome c [Hyphomicrobiales bacterium]
MGDKHLRLSLMLCRRASECALAFTLALYAGVSIISAQDRAGELAEPARQGLVLAERLCAHCHAVGRSGSSPHAGAPPFRTLGQRVDLDAFKHQLLDHFSSGHPDMPTFRFSRDDAHALVAYLRSIQGP